eukprot:16335_1
MNSDKLVLINVNGKCYVDGKSHLIVFGFIRQFEHLLIPPAIFNMCLKYYYYGLYFDKCSKHIKISGECNETVTVNKGKSNINCKYLGASVYGQIWFDSMCEKIIICKFQVNQSVEECDMVIGITSSIATFGDYFSILDANWYAYLNAGYKMCNPSEIRPYGQMFLTNDTVTMILNLSTSTLSFEINDKPQGIAFDNIVKGKDIKYKIAVSAWNNSDSVSIIDFKIKDP